ncbi:MAG: hypothetical protein JRN15_24490, partial [Nitrososphaerota archaeon]|nr:hypothetical protein [Nitrososphaerota archaeon]
MKFKYIDLKSGRVNMISFSQLKVGIGFVKYQVRNRIDLLLLLVGMKGRAEIRFRNNDAKLEINARNRTITLKSTDPSRAFYFPAGRANMIKSLISIYEIYLGEIYRILPVKGRIVVDIGAGLGDSAVYFALKGASHLYAYEPDDTEFRSAVRNITLNQSSGIITIFNCSVIAGSSEDPLCKNSSMLGIVNTHHISEAS